MTTNTVSYEVDGSTTARFEVDADGSFRPAGPGQVLGRMRDAIDPAMKAANTVLDRAKEIGPDEVEVTFGIKINGGVDWVVAKSAGEASFEIKMTWSRSSSDNNESVE